MTIVKANSVIVDTCGARIAAMKKHITNSKTEISIGGAVFKPADVNQVYQDSIDARRSVSTKRAELKSALTTRAAAETKRRSVDAGMKAYVINRFGADSTEAHEFGFSPKKVTPPTSDVKSLAAKKARATRAARHTMGKLQKKDIKGTVVETAPVAGPAPTATAQPGTAPVNVVVNTTAPAAGSNGAQAPSNGTAGGTAHA